MARHLRTLSNLKQIKENTHSKVKKRHRRQRHGNERQKPTPTAALSRTKKDSKETGDLNELSMTQSFRDNAIC